MTQALDAAVRAYFDAASHPVCVDGVRAALHAALPAEPTPEMMSAIREAYWNQAKADYLHSVYHGIRAHILGEDA